MPKDAVFFLLIYLNLLNFFDSKIIPFIALANFGRRDLKEDEIPGTGHPPGQDRSGPSAPIPCEARLPPG